MNTPSLSAKSKLRCRRRNAVSLLELIAVVALVGIISSVIITRVNTDDTNQIKDTAGNVHMAEIDLQAQLFFRNTGNWPAADLSDIGGNKAYFPNGLPKPPNDAAKYQFNRSTHRTEMTKR